MNYSSSLSSNAYSNVKSGDDKRINRKLFINNISCAMLISCQLIFGVIGIENISTYFSLFIVFLQLINNRKKLLRIQPIIVVAVTLFLFLISFLLNGSNSFLHSYFIRFCLFGIVGAVCFSQECSIKAIFKYSTYILLVSLPFVFIKLINVSMLAQSEVYMSWSYIVFPLFCISCFSLRYKYANMFICIINVIASMFILIMYGTRGIFISIIFFIFFWIVLSSKKSAAFKITISVIAFIIGFAIYYNLENIISLLYNFFNSKGISVFALDKAYRYIALNKLDNGRQVIYSNAINGFLDNILGHSISNFELRYNLHCHNVFLQAAYEFGIGGIVLMIIIVIKCFIKCNRLMDDFSRLLFFLFTASFGVLIVSSTYWQNPFFWFLLPLLFIKKKGEIIQNV